MNRLLAFVLVLFGCSLAHAGEPVIQFYPYCHNPKPKFLIGCCPDDYCKKPLPCVSCDWCGTCDDYCKKPLPCVKCDWCGTCDDYCKKPGAISLSKCLPPWFKCYSSCGSGGQ